MQTQGYLVRTDAFQGPLDLLLQLVEAEKLDIGAIALARVTEPFVQAIRERAQDERYPLEDLAHFLVVAAKLVALKARLLVPRTDDAEEDGTSLVERLRAYQGFVKAAEWFRLRSEGGALLFSRGPHEEEPVAVLPEAPPVARLAEAMRAVLRRRERPVPPTRAAVMERLVTLEERMDVLKGRLAEGRSVSFRAWVGDAPTRELAVVSFLALLELLRGGALTVAQPDLFADLTISSL